MMASCDSHYIIMSNVTLETSYQRWFIAGAYDALARAVFAPAGGLAALRRGALQHFAIAPGERVLELGCGSGGVTALLAARGALVTAVDWSAPMLRRAAQRAPGARFVRSEITAYQPEAAFDVVLLCFVLHELDAPARAAALQVARRALRPGGRLAVVDHAVPERGAIPRLMSRVVQGFEPGTSSGSWYQPGGAEAEIAQAGFTPGPSVSLASGMAFALTGRMEMAVICDPPQRMPTTR
jgi:SAM-dependent methyltransferase